MSRPGARHGDTPRYTYTAQEVRRWRDQWRGGRMTLKQIAEEAGASVSTVTRLLTKEALGELE